MHQGRLWSVLAALALAAGCRSPSAEAPIRTPVRWVLVESRVSDLGPWGRAEDGQVDPEAKLLTLEPLYPEDIRWNVVLDLQDYSVEILELRPNAQAAPGETVTATVRVARARPDDLYRLTARASQAEVEILGEPEAIVRGGGTAAFRFTSRVSGRAGIAVGVELLGPEGR